MALAFLHCCCLRSFITRAEGPLGGRKLFEIDTGGVVDSYPARAGDGTLLVGSESGVLLALRD